MRFMLVCHDRPNSLDLRKSTRERHLAYIQNSGTTVWAGGALLTDDGETMIGSLVILETETLDAAKEWAAGDPYAKAGLFENVEIHPWNWVVGAAGTK